MNQKQIARRPTDELDQVSDRFSFVCNTCWQGVIQPVIKGIFYHSDDWQQKSFKCKNIEPIKINDLRKETNLHCIHEFRFHPDLGGAVKCIKCNLPERIDLFELKNERRDYYCIGCKKRFKILSEHYIKVHKKKGFEYNKLEMKI